MQTIGGISNSEQTVFADYRVQRINNVENATRQSRDNTTTIGMKASFKQNTNQKVSLDKESLSEEQKQRFEEELKTANESLLANGKQLRFKYDDEAKSLYVEVLDSKTQEVVVSLPPEFLIDLSKRMKELIGLFFDKKA